MLGTLTRFHIKMKEQLERSDELYKILTQYYKEYQELCKSNPTKKQLDDFLKRRQEAISPFLEN
jgi:hypothetical protein